MAYKAILVHVEATKASEARVVCAADLADRFGALLIGCGSEMAPSLHPDPFGAPNGDLLMAMAERVEEHLAQAEVTFERLAGARSKRWISERSMPDETIVAAARAADLIVTSLPEKGKEDPVRNEDPGLLVVISGRPVLVVPPQKDYLAARRILVCWKDTRESRRALSDALPFLQKADEVLVAEVAPRADLAAACKRANEVAESLCRHGVRATGEGLLRDERRTASILLDRASCFAADLIVSGGYGRSRIGEWAFGGVTKALLGQDQYFVLLSH